MVLSNNPSMQGINQIYTMYIAWIYIIMTGFLAQKILI